MIVVSNAIVNYHAGSALNSREYRKNCTCRNPCQETKYVTTASYSQFGSNFINDVLRQKDILPDEGYVR